LVNKADELWEFYGVDMALIICKLGRYTTYRSRDHKSWPSSMEEIVSEAITCLIYTTGANIDVANCVLSPEEYIAIRNRKAPLKNDREIELPRKDE
jgi:hypothetical protein